MAKTPYRIYYVASSIGERLDFVEIFKRRIL